jgi:hypothetical protein
LPQQQGKPKPTREERNKLLDESMQRAYAKVSAEMPDVKKVSVTPSSSSFYTSLLVPKGALAVTNPFTGNISYNPDSFEGQSQDEIENTIAHELTHVRQSQNTPWYGHLADVANQLVQNTKGMLGMTREDQVPEGIPASSPLHDPYYWRPREMEAFQTEKDRAARMHQSNFVDPMLGTRDINLPAPIPKKQPGIDTGPRYAFGQTASQFRRP